MTDNEEFQDEGKDARAEAAVRGIELLFDTPPERMKELTRIGKRQSLSMSLMRTFDDLAGFLSDEMTDPKDDEQSPSDEDFVISEAYLNYYEQYQRSVNGEHRRMLGEITMEQMSDPLDDKEEFND